MAIIKALEEWSPECKGAAHKLQLLTDHKNLEYSMSKMLLNRWKARWAEFLSTFDYEIVYWPSKSSGKVDALVWRPEDLAEGEDESLNTMEPVVLKPGNLPEQQCNLAKNLRQGYLILAQCEKVCEQDGLPNTVLEALRQGTQMKEITIAECSEKDGYLYYQRKK
jgi:hypothetical protein